MARKLVAVLLAALLTFVAVIFAMPHVACSAEGVVLPATIGLIVPVTLLMLIKSAAEGKWMTFVITFFFGPVLYEIVAVAMNATLIAACSR